MTGQKSLGCQEWIHDVSFPTSTGYQQPCLLVVVRMNFVLPDGDCSGPASFFLFLFFDKTLIFMVNLNGLESPHRHISRSIY